MSIIGKAIAQTGAWCADFLVSILVRRGYADQVFWKRCHTRALRARGFGGGADIEKGGEEAGAMFLKSILSSNPVIVDIGANEGQYTAAMLKMFPTASIHCLEPQRRAFDVLQRRFADTANVHVHNVAVATHTGIATLYADVSGSTLGSLTKRRLDHFGIAIKHEEEVATVALVDFLRINDLDEIDVLKLDIEGGELAVLQSADLALRQGEIMALQFEFGGANIDSKTYWQDFYYLLSDSYKLYRLTPSGVQLVEAYDEMDEVFVTTNYLAIRRNPQV